MGAGDADRVDQLAATMSGSASAMPLPDCAPEGCSRLRIIDGNAEQFRAALQTQAAEAAPAGAAAAPVLQ